MRINTWAGRAFFALVASLFFLSCDSGGGMDQQTQEIEVEASVTVTAADDGQPLRGASVRLSRVDNGNTLVSGTTGDDGRLDTTFAVAESDAPSRLLLSVSAEDFMEVRDTLQFRSSVSRDVGLESAVMEATVSGAVTSARAGNPVEEATVVGTRGNNGDQLFQTTTASDGTYEATFGVSDVPSEITISAEATDFEPEDQTVSFGEEVTVDLSLPPVMVDVVITGVISSAKDGRSVGGATVEAFRPSKPDSALADTTSGTDGTYELSLAVPAPTAPGELRLGANDPRFSGDTLSVGFRESIAQDLALPPIRISTLDELQAIQTDPDFPLNGTYLQTADIDASPTSAANGGKGFIPIGSAERPFNGTFDGNGFAITNLTIDRPDEVNVGLFGVVAKGETPRIDAAEGMITDVILSEAGITGAQTVGGIAGHLGDSEGNSSSLIDGSEVSGVVTAVEGFTSGPAGGIVGRNEQTGEIRNASVHGSVSSVHEAGGVAGINIGTIEGAASRGEVRPASDEDGTEFGGIAGVNNGGTITNSESSADISRTNAAGGIVGRIEGGTVSGTQFTASISAATAAGGIAGSNVEAGTVKASRSSGSISDVATSAGGIVGSNGESATVKESRSATEISTDALRVGGVAGFNNGLLQATYSVGAVTGQNAGGVAGTNGETGAISNSYAAGSVTSTTGGTLGDGGIVANRENSAEFSDSFWDVEATGQDFAVRNESNVDGTTGLTTSEMQGERATQNMTGLDFQDTWKIVTDPAGYPALQWEQ